MAGVMMNPVPATASVDLSNGRLSSQSHVNNSRISDFVERLLGHVRGGSRNVNEIGRLCFSLSRHIDYAVRNNEVPDRALELPYILKQVCQWTNDTLIQTAIMVLMISIKGACRNGWFGEKDKEELCILWNEISTSFCNVRDMSSGECTVDHSISTVLTRFYPRMKMGEILAFIEAMPGYGAIIKDFHVTKKPKSPDEIYLFVAQTDATETSLCITSPQLVNFLMNGKAVNKRTCLCQDPGPQIPTLITDLVKDGTNLLQVVGQFNGKYIIVVGFMSMVSNPSCPVLPDYVPPVAAASDPDNDIVEGPSRISLNCPISKKRIKTPVKGHLCKHLQCFDFDNYVDINSRRPSWRCPYCSQSVCYTDIRIDQCMAKVLKEVDATISHVKIAADGSWKAVNGCDDHEDKQQDKSHSHQEATPPSNMGGVIMDLTEGDNDTDATNSHQENEKKPSPNLLHSQPNHCVQTPIHANTNHVHTMSSHHMDNRSFGPSHGNVTSNTNSQGQTVISGSNIQLPTHAMMTSNAVMNPNLQGQSQTQVSASTMQFQHGLNMMSNDYGLRYTTPNMCPTRNQFDVQAFPAQNPAGVVRSDLSRFQMEQHQMMCMMAASMPENMGSQNRLHHNLSPVSSQPAQQFDAYYGTSHQSNGHHLGPSHQSTGHHFNPHQHQAVNHMIPNLVQSPDQLQPQVHQGYVGPTVGHVSNQVAHHLVGSMNAPVSNQQAHHYVGPMSAPVSNQQAHRYSGPVTSPITNQQIHHSAYAAAPQAPQISSWTPPVSVPLQTTVSSIPMTLSEMQRGVGQGVRTQEGSANASADQNWRPTGRMRGSLSGQAYSQAFNEAIRPPIQPLLAVSPPVLNTPRPFVPAHLQVLVANNINANGNGFEEGADGSVLDGVGNCWSLP